jgi:DNA-directed RNA polymerase specialized sigma24 family protein
VHNALPEEQRRAFREVVLEGRDLDELARAGERSATEIARAARRALLAVLGEIETGGGA